MTKKMKTEGVKPLFLDKWRRKKNRGDKALINPKGCCATLKWNEIEDVTDKVLREMREINDNYDNAILDVSKEVKTDI